MKPVPPAVKPIDIELLMAAPVEEMLEEEAEVEEELETCRDTGEGLEMEAPGGGSFRELSTATVEAR